MSFINELTEVSKINQRFMYRRNSRETSIEAARSVHPSLSAIALEVLRYAYDQGYAGFTDIQLAIDLDCETSTYRSRRADLTRLGYIVDNGEEEEEPKSYVLPAKYEVCPTCNGRGSHVRPSVDAGGYNFDDDDYDPETGESVYWSGMYDQTCETCHGRTTVPVIDRDRADKATLAIWDERCEEDADYERICRMERMMGC